MYAGKSVEASHAIACPSWNHALADKREGRVEAERAVTEKPPEGYTVLVVDRGGGTASRVCMLTWSGYQALEARHGREALATIEGHAGPIHLILTDIKMPGMEWAGSRCGRRAAVAGQTGSLYVGIRFRGLSGRAADPGTVSCQAVYPGRSCRQGRRAPSAQPAPDESLPPSSTAKFANRSILAALRCCVRPAPVPRGGHRRGAASRPEAAERARQILNFAI